MQQIAGPQLKIAELMWGMGAQPLLRARALSTAGAITAVPLILFALAAKRLKLATIGMMQYMTPSLQFLIAVLVFREPFSSVEAIAFGLIWTALIVFTTDSVIGERKARRLARAARLAE